MRFFVDAAAAVDDPGLVDLVLREPVRVEEARAEVAVDHAHRGVAEHEDEDLAGADLAGDVAGEGGGLGGDGGVVGDLVLGVGDAAGGAPLVEAVHEGAVGGPVGRVGPGAGEAPAETLEAGAGVEEADEAGPAAGEVAGEQQRVVLADGAVTGVRAVEPVDADADHRVLDRAELLDRLVRLREEARDAVGGAAELLQGAFHLLGRFLHRGEGELVGLGAGVAGPEESDRSWSWWEGTARPRAGARGVRVRARPCRGWRRRPGGRLRLGLRTHSQARDRTRASHWQSCDPLEQRSDALHATSEGARANLRPARAKLGRARANLRRPSKARTRSSTSPPGSSEARRRSRDAPPGSSEARRRSRDAPPGSSEAPPRPRVARLPPSAAPQPSFSGAEEIDILRTRSMSRSPLLASS